MADRRAALPNQLMGMHLAADAYPHDHSDNKWRLPPGWHDIRSLDLDLDFAPEFNLQRAASGRIENSFEIFVNAEERKIVFAFKGSDVFSNYKSDILNGGAASFAKIAARAQAAFDQVIADVNLAQYAVSTTGHSLGGAMAQMFALKNGLDVQVYNSLPLARSIINNGYLDPVDLDTAVKLYEQSGAVVSDVRMPNEIATYFYQYSIAGPYLSDQVGQAVTYLPGAYLAHPMKTLALAGSLPFALLAFAGSHKMVAVLDAAAGLGIDEANGQLIIPDGHQTWDRIPASARRHLARLTASPITRIASFDGAVFTIERADGARQWLRVDAAHGETIVQQAHPIGITETVIGRDGSVRNALHYAGGTKIGAHTAAALASLFLSGARGPSDLVPLPFDVARPPARGHIDAGNATAGVVLSGVRGQLQDAIAQWRIDGEATATGGERHAPAAAAVRTAVPAAALDEVPLADASAAFGSVALDTQWQSDAEKLIEAMAAFAPVRGLSTFVSGEGDPMPLWLAPNV